MSGLTRGGGHFESPVWVYTAVLLASLGGWVRPRPMCFVIAQQYSTWVERASATVLVTTVTRRRHGLLRCSG